MNIGDEEQPDKFSTPLRTKEVDVSKIETKIKQKPENALTQGGFRVRYYFKIF